MSRYKRERGRSRQDTWRCTGWFTKAPDREWATFWTPHGLARLWRVTEACIDYGGLQFIFAGRSHCVTFKPCPTRKGVERMARAEIERIVKEAP